MWLLAILLLIIFAYISYRRSLYGVVIVIILLPTYLWRLQLAGLPSTFLELMILILFAAWLIKDRRYSRLNLLLKDRAQNKIAKPLRLLLVGWLLVSILAMATNFSWAGLGLWRAYFLEPLMFFLVLVYSVNSRHDVRQIIKALAILLIGLALASYWQHISDWNLPSAYDTPNVRRLTGLFSYPNALSLLSAPLAAFFVGLFVTSRQQSQRLWYMLIAILGISLSFLARSEGAILALNLSLLMWLVLAKKARKLTLIILGVVIVLTLTFYSPLGQIQNIKQQLLAPELDLQATSLEIRSSQWQETWAMLQDNFWTGSGLAAYQQVMTDYHRVEWLEIYLYPHNIFLNFWTEMGLLGLALIIIFLSYIKVSLLKLFKDEHWLAWPLTLAWLTWFIHGLVDVPYFKNDLSILFFVLLALTILADERTK